MEAENTDLANDLKSVQMAKQESERKRKQAEASNAEMSLKLAELERVSGDAGDKAKKLAVCRTVVFYTHSALTKNKDMINSCCNISFVLGTLWLSPCFILISLP